MDPQRIVVLISLLSLFISLFALYKSYYQKPSRKIWSGLSLYLLSISQGKNEILPLIVLQFNFYNSGAVLAVIENIQFKLFHKKSESEYTFIPYKECDNFSEDEKNTFQAFKLIAISPRTQNPIQKFIAFQEKAGAGHFVPIEGDYVLTIEVKWEGKNALENLRLAHEFILTKSEIDKWMNKAGSQKIVTQIMSENQPTR